MSPTPTFSQPEPPQRSGLLTALVAGALIANPRERQAVLEAVELEPRLELAAQAAAAALARTTSNASAPN